MERTAVQKVRALRRWVGVACAAGCVGLGAVGAGSVRATEELVFATIERAGPEAPASVRAVSDPETLFSLERELSELPPSTRGFPRWLVHLFSGSERQRSFVVFEEDLKRFPTVARVIGEGVGRERYLYRVELPGPYWKDSDGVVERLARTGSRPLFYSGERSNWPYVEVILTEQVEAGLPVEPVAAEEREAKAAFMERVGALLKNKTRDATLNASYERLANQLYRYHRDLTQNPDVTQFYTRYRRYRWRGDGGSRVAVRVEYRTPDLQSAAAIDEYLRDRATRSAGQLEPETFGIELLSDAPTPNDLRRRLSGEFPDVVSVRPGRPQFE